IGVPIRRSEFLFADRSSYSPIGVPIRRSEFPFADRSSYSPIGVPIRRSEFLFVDRSSHSPIGVPVDDPPPAKCGSVLCPLLSGGFFCQIPASFGEEYAFCRSGFAFLKL